MKKEMTASEREAFNNKEIREKYFLCVRDMAKYEEFSGMNWFKHEYPEQFAFYSKVHRLRNEIKKDYEAMKLVSEKVYFGTLTFNAAKNQNKVETKRKDAFQKLNSIFKYVLLVEEYGGVNGRYHIHFLAAFPKDHNFNNFITLWHSRQNLEECSDNNVGKYLVSYVVKDLPRLRRNRLLVHLREKVSNIKRAEFMTEVHKCPIEDVAEKIDSLVDFDNWAESTFVKVVAK